MRHDEQVTMCSLEWLEHERRKAWQEGYAAGTTCSKRSSDDIKECIVTLSDTRQVVCVVYSGYQRGGLSCDWDHVSGADKEPAR